MTVSCKTVVDSQPKRLAKRALVSALVSIAVFAVGALAQSTHTVSHKAVKKTSKTSKTTTTAAASQSEPIAATGKPLVVDFAAVWCGPCKRFGPVFDKVSGQFSNKAEFRHIDVDQQPQYANYYKVNSVPTVLILDGTGAIKYEHSGIIDEKTLVDEVSKVAK